MDNKTIFFFGELPPKTVHGASLSNKINIQLLQATYYVDIVEEFSDLKYHSKFSLKKVKYFLFPLLRSWFLFISKKYSFYYGVIYLSFFGLMKNLILAIPFKIFNPRGKIILHFHRSDMNRCLSSKVNKKLFIFLNIFIDRFIVLSEKQILEVKAITSKEVFLLRNSIEEHDLKILSPLPSDKIVLLFISNFIKEKGFFDIIEAQKRINSIYPDTFELRCYGTFSNSNAEEVSLNDLDKNGVKIFEKVYGTEKNLVLNEADIIVLPSYNEGLPLVLIEALYLHKPIIISNVGYIEEILGVNYPLYCEPGNIESIVKCIITCNEGIDRVKLRQFMADKYELFSISKHKEALLNIFK